MELHKTVSDGSKRRQNIPFALSIYTKQNPIYSHLSAYGLRQFLNRQFKTNNVFVKKNIQCLEIKYTILKNEELMRFSESLKSAPLTIDTQFNKIDCNQFMKTIFAKCDTIVTCPMSQEVAESLKQVIEMKSSAEDEFCNSLQIGLKKMMTVYNSDQYSQNILSTQLQRGTPQKTRQQIKITGYMKMYQSDYRQVFKQNKFVYSGNFKNSEFFIKDLPRPKFGKQGKELSSIQSWKIGFVHQGNFIPYFEIDELKSKLSKINSSIKVVSGLMKQPEFKIKRFEVYSELFQGLLIKFQIRKVHISHIYVRKQEDQDVFYIKMDYPPKFSATVLDAKHDQQIGYINTWKRIQNFTIVDHDKIKNNELLRLHLFNNVVIRIQVKKSSNDLSKKILDEIYKESMPKCSISTFKENAMTLKNAIQHIDYNKFNRKFINLDKEYDGQQDLKWDIQYLILCLLSRGLISAFQVEELTVFIEENKSYQTFAYIFDQMCDLQSLNFNGNQNKEEKNKGLSYIKNKFAEYSKLSDDLLETQYDQDFIAVRVWRIQITPTGYLFCNKAPQMKSRMQREYFNDIGHFIRAAIVDDDGNQIKNQLYLSKKVYRQMIAGFKVVNRSFIPLGWSPSQLRGFSLWYINQYKRGQEILQRSQVLNFLGEFGEISPPAKMAARIGQAFSSSWYVKIKGFEKVNVQIIKDIQVFNKKINKTLNFTDGIGKISSNLIEKISTRLKLHEELGAIQVRYLGAKGVLVVDDSLPNNTIQIRPSMKKFQCNHPNAKKYLDILDWNKYKAGFLNRQIIILLSSRGVSNEVFLGLQKDYLKDIQSLTYKQCTIFKQLVSDEHNQNLFNLQPANKIIFGLMSSGFDLDKEPFFRGVMQILKRNGYEKLKQKSNINVKKSARLIGIIDEYGVLKQNQVYCRILDPFNTAQGESKPISGNVIVVRNPCLHTADVRKLRAASEQQVLKAFDQLYPQKQYTKQTYPFSKYPNTVIMSQKGETPITSAISGSDLDGDNFYISWDESLITISDEAPYIHQDNKLKPKSQRISNTVDSQDYNKMLNFFCDYMNYDSLGKIANSHLIKADQNLIKKAYDEKCIELAIAHGHAVDFPKTGFCPSIDQDLLMVKAYPDFMQKQDQPSYVSESILGILYRDVKKMIQAPIVERISEQSGQTQSLDGDLLFTKQNLNFQIEDVKDTLETLYMFSQDIQRIKFLANLQNQFQIYTGNVTAKTKGKPKKNKGFKHNKLMQQIVTLKQKYLKIFFGDQKTQKYKQTQRKDLGQVFENQIKQKAALWYCVSYAEYFKQKLTYTSKDNLQTLRSSIISAKKNSSLQFSEMKQLLGLVWFIIPKILMEMKMNAVKYRKQNQHILSSKDIQEQQQKSQMQNSMYDSEYIPQSSKIEQSRME